MTCEEAKSSTSELRWTESINVWNEDTSVNYLKYSRKWWTIMSIVEAK